MVKTRSLQLATRLESQIKSFGRMIVGFLAVLFALGFHQGALSQTTEDKTIARKLFQGGWDLKFNGNPLAAIVLFESGLKLEPENRLAHLHLGVIYEALGDGSSAKQHYSEVIRLAPKSAEAAKARTRLSANTPTPKAAKTFSTDSTNVSSAARKSCTDDWDCPGMGRCLQGRCEFVNKW